MILKKPYGFLIKHFRIIHLLITALLVYIVSKYRGIYLYLLKCINDLVNKYDASVYINYSIFIFIFFGLLLFLVVYWLLKYKDKPRNIYIVAIIGYIIAAISLIFIFEYFNGFSNNVISNKTLRLCRDIVFLLNIFQYFMIIIMLIRGLGFNIKKFNFEKDAQELNLVDSDNEEVEVNVSVDTTNIFRKVRKQKRELGYFYQEYKVYVIIIIIILVLILGYKTYNYFSLKYKMYNQNEYVGDDKYINITDSNYIINKDKNYVVIKFNTFKNGQSDKLNTGNIILNIGDEKYHPNKNICYKFKYLGNCYKQQYINNQKEEYILVYEVDTLNVNKAYITYNESYDKIYKIKLNLQSKEHS